jgi:hypothetical protein
MATRGVVPLNVMNQSRRAWNYLRSNPAEHASGEPHFKPTTWDVHLFWGISTLFFEESLLWDSGLRLAIWSISQSIHRCWLEITLAYLGQAHGMDTNFCQYMPTSQISVATAYDVTLLTWPCILDQTPSSIATHSQALIFRSLSWSMHSIGQTHTYAVGPKEN